MPSPPQSLPYALLRFPPHAPGHSGARLLLLSPLPLLLSLVPLLSLLDCKPASHLNNYPSNSHSVVLPPALQYLSELLNKPDGLVKNAVQVPPGVPLQITITIFAHCFP